MKAPTPRTDKAEFSFDAFNGVDPWEGERWIKVVPSKISAELESELAAVTEQRDEARGQLAEIEDKMRVELGGHPNSKLWGEAGLIAATMRCVDALGEVTEQRDRLLEQQEQWRLSSVCRELVEQRDRLAAALEQIIEQDDMPMSIRVSSKSVARKALQSITPNEP